jgi:hypothetical protein
MKAFNLDGLSMNAVQTASNGVVNAETLFRFRQEAGNLYAEYAGGRVARGYLVGTLSGERVGFRYC